MTRTFKSLVIALSGAGFLASGAADAQACHGRHRGGGGHRVVVVRAQPQYVQQAYRPVRPVQQVPQFGQPGMVQGQNGAVGVQFQGQTAQTGGAQASAISALGGEASGVAVQGQTGVSSSQQTVFGQQQVNSQAQFGGAPAANNVGGTAATGGQVQQQAQFQPQTQSQQTAQPQIQSQAQSQVQSQAQTTEQNAQTMALEALSGLDSSDMVPAATQASAQSAQPGLTGNYSASLSTVGATIRLQLNADGSFNWIVLTKDGKTSNFQGSYTINSGLLTLARTDSRKLEASVTPTAGGFSLKLVGQNATPLSFVRV